MSDSLFSEFDPVSAKAWKQKIQFDLKGADYNDTLVWESPEGIHVKPFYHGDDFKEEFDSIPGHPSSWSVTQKIFIDNTSVANKLLKQSITRGAEAVLLVSEKEFNISVLLADVSLNGITIYFQLKFLSSAFYLKLIDYCQTNKLKAFYNLDIIGNLAKTGNWFHNLKTDHSVTEDIVKVSPENSLGVDMSLFQNAGANMVQQLAYGLAQANEYFNHFQDEEKLSVTFQVAVGSNYFFEIAKIRTLRKLYATLASEYGLAETCHVLAMPSKRNKTLYDYNVNMLRTTTESMSAVLGGANAVCNLPYDAIYHKSNEFGERISRNQLLVLKSESYFDWVANAADGTYYVERLTDELATKALEVFKTIEAGGGFLRQLKEGIIQKKIKESAQKEQELFDAGALTLVGTNKYVNENDRMKKELELYPFVKTNPRKTLVEPIIEKRYSETTEKERLDHEN